MSEPVIHSDGFVEISNVEAGACDVTFSRRDDEYQCEIQAMIDGVAHDTVGRGGSPDIAVQVCIGCAMSWVDGDRKKNAMRLVVRRARYAAEDVIYLETQETAAEPGPVAELPDLEYGMGMGMDDGHYRLVLKNAVRSPVATIYASVHGDYNPEAYAKLFAGSVTLLAEAREVIREWDTLSSPALNNAVNRLRESIERAGG